MSLPELPSEQDIAKRLKSVRQLVGRYGRTVSLALRSPTWLVRHSVGVCAARHTTAQIRPIPFTLLTLVFASLVHKGAVAAFGVGEPFFGDLTYLAQILAFQHAIESFGKSLPGRMSASIVLWSLEFAIVLLVVVFWARTLAGRTRRYWTDVAALSYLLPLVLIGYIVEYSAVNLLYRMIGESVLLFAGGSLLIAVLAASIVYGIVFRVVDQVYFVRGWRRVIHATGYVIVVPVLLVVLEVAMYAAPVGFYAHRVVSPMVEGDRKLLAGDYEAAETLFDQAIQSDPTGFWSGGARIRLISVDARRILALLPSLSYDSGMREQLHRYLAQTDPFRRVVQVSRPEGVIKVTAGQLIQFREAILDSYVTAGDIPITNSELDCALRPTAVQEGCDQLPKEAIAGGMKTPIGRQRLFYQIYRARALLGEPSTADARRYLQFLAELPIRIELLWVRYRARNLMRDSETLGHLDDEDRRGGLDRDKLIRVNGQIRDQDAKYAHLKMPDIELEKLSNRELGFLFRQAYLNYLQAEARMLEASRVCIESSLIQQRVASIQEQLRWVAHDAMYRNVPPQNRLDAKLMELLGLK